MVRYAVGMTSSVMNCAFNESVSIFRVLKECRGLWDILDSEELRWNKEKFQLIEEITVTHT